jgi:hypothetical protein
MKRDRHYISSAISARQRQLMQRVWMVQNKVTLTGNVV